jgi:uncharacterized glyoxalase superfamily protein PhnB
MTQANRSMPPGIIIPTLGYADVRGAARWLCRVFGFTERMRIGDHRIQLTYRGTSMVVTEGKSDGGGHGVMVAVEDVDAHHAHVLACGVTTATAPKSEMYGERQYSVIDPGGHRWVFTESIDDIDPASYGGELLTND